MIHIINRQVSFLLNHSSFFYEALNHNYWNITNSKHREASNTLEKTVILNLHPTQCEAGIAYLATGDLVPTSKVCVLVTSTRAWLWLTHRPGLAERIVWCRGHFIWWGRGDWFSIKVWPLSRALLEHHSIRYFWGLHFSDILKIVLASQLSGEKPGFPPERNT